MIGEEYWDNELDGHRDEELYELLESRERGSDVDEIRSFLSSLTNAKGSYNPLNVVVSRYYRDLEDFEDECRSDSFNRKTSGIWDNIEEDSFFGSLGSYSEEVYDTDLTGDSVEEVSDALEEIERDLEAVTTLNSGTRLPAFLLFSLGEKFTGTLVSNCLGIEKASVSFFNSDWKDRGLVDTDNKTHYYPTEKGESLRNFIMEVYDKSYKD